MNWIDQTIREFGHQIGIADLALSEHGSAQLQTQSGTVLGIEPVAGAVLVYITAMLAFEEEGIKLRALRAADARRQPDFPLQIGVTGQGMETALIALTRIPERAFALPLLMQSFDTLRRWFDDLSKNDARR